MESPRLLREWLYAIGALALAAFLALSFGAVWEASSRIIFELRLPRVLLGAAVGMGLAVSGVALQALFSNPLCEPYTLGISSGSALGAAIGVSMGWLVPWFGLSFSSLLGALAFSSVLLLISSRSRLDQTGLLLSGVMLGFFGSSLLAIWMALSDPQGVQNAIFWLLGDLSRARFTGSLLTLGTCLVMTGILWLGSFKLDASLMGEEDARSLGISVRSFRTRVILITSLLIALCVSGAGMIGFVGLIVPHLVRARVGIQHRRVIPFAAVWGAALVIISDLVARTIAAPSEIPVGVITALVGAPIFLRSVIGKRKAILG